MQQIITSYQEAPSNIAIVKYWGKRDIQKPINPSLSFTLSQARTRTNVSYHPDNIPLSIHFTFEGKSRASFTPKLESFINNIRHLLPFLEKGNLYIDSNNTFPHSSGIASSASSMAAMAKALVDINLKMGHEHPKINELTSEIARLGSGSASRSTQNGWILWGKTSQIDNSSDCFGVNINQKTHPYFSGLKDSILVIRKGAKAVSSTAGHQSMNHHPYKEGRIQQANNNIHKLLNALETGAFGLFSKVCEEEALSLHGLMMSSTPGYTLMEPNTLTAIQRLLLFRQQQQIPVTFTLDAGPNLHIIYHKTQSSSIKSFIAKELTPLCEDQTVIYDEISMSSNNI